MIKELNCLDELPHGWIRTQLGEVAEIILGQSPPSSTYNEDGRGLPFYQGKLEFGKSYPTPRKWCTAPKKIAEKGDVLISVRAPVGPTNICPEKSCIGRGLAAIRGLGGIGTFFILYVLRALESEIARKGTGTTFSAIGGDKLKALEIPLPPLNEQERIVARLEELFTRLDAGVEGLRKVKAQLKRYRQAVLKYAFEGRLTEEWRKTHKHEEEPVAKLLESLKQKRARDGRFKEFQIDATDIAELPEAWAWVPLGNLVTFKNGINFKSEQKGEKGILTIDVLNMYSNSIYIKLDNLYRVNINLKDDYFLRPGDILLVRSSVKREGVGWATAFKGSSEPVTFCGFIICARLQDALILPEYLIYYLRSNLARNRIIGGSSQVVITNISQGSFGKIPVPISPPPEQAKIVEEIERYYSLAFQTEDIIDRSIGQAESLKRNILKMAFDGKLVPQDPSDEPAEKLLERIREERKKSKGEQDIDKKKSKPKQLELPTYVK